MSRTLRALTLEINPRSRNSSSVEQARVVAWVGETRIERPGEDESTKRQTQGSGGDQGRRGHRDPYDHGAGRKNRDDLALYRRGVESCVPRDRGLYGGHCCAWRPYLTPEIYSVTGNRKIYRQYLIFSMSSSLARRFVCSLSRRRCPYS